MKQPASLEEVLNGQVVTVEAVIRILERKGLLSRNEVMQEIVKVKKELTEKHGRN